MKKFDRQKDGNDLHELEIVFDVSNALFLFVDISIVLIESKNKWTFIYDTATKTTNL